jgi:hypothetical protein
LSASERQLERLTLQRERRGIERLRHEPPLPSEDEMVRRENRRQGIGIRQSFRQAAVKPSHEQS